MSILKMIEKRIEKQILDLDDEFKNKNKDIQSGIAFMQYSLGVIFHSLDQSELEDGIVDSAFRDEGYDYGIDAMYLTADDNIITSPDEIDDYNKDTKFIFHILQFKKGTGASLESILKLKEGVKTAFIDNKVKPSQNMYMHEYVNNIVEIRDPLYERFSTKNIEIKVYYCFSGIKNNILNNPLLEEELKNIQMLLNENGYSSAKFEVIGAQELIDLERNEQEIEDVIKFKKSFKYISDTDEEETLNGYICIVEARVIGELVKKYQSRLFEANIRDYYPKNDINEKIVDTCSSEAEGKYFWSFNNGLTITCNKVEELPNDKYRVKGLQIVNGCQTSNAIYKSLINLERYCELESKKDLDEIEDEEYKNVENNRLNEKSTVLVKFIETKNPELIYKITETTNSQTAIKVFSLKANEDIHKNLEQFFLDHNIYYERRVNYYKNKKVKPIIDIQKLSQLFLSMILFKPSQARANPKKMFLNDYYSIFPKSQVKIMNYDLYLIPVLVHLKVEKIIRNIQRNKLEIDEYKLTLLSNGKFHIDCLILSTILKNKYSEMGIIENSAKIKELLQDDKEIMLIFDEALETFKKIVQSYAGMKKESISVALRKADLDKKIVRFINKK